MRVWVGSLRVSGRAPLRLRPRFQTADPAREEDGEASSADFGSSEREDGAAAPTLSPGSPERDLSRVRHKLRRFLQRRPTLQSLRERGYIKDQVFGCALATLCAREKSSVPYFVQQCVRAVEARGTRGSLGAGLGGQGGPQAGAWDLGGRVSASFSTGLDTDGLYRISGNLATIQKLRYHVDHSESPALSCRGRLQTHLQTRPRSAPP